MSYCETARTLLKVLQPSSVTQIGMGEFYLRRPAWEMAPAEKCLGHVSDALRSDAGAYEAIIGRDASKLREPLLDFLYSMPGYDGKGIMAMSRGAGSAGVLCHDDVVSVADQAAYVLTEVLRHHGQEALAADGVMPKVIHCLVGETMHPWDFGARKVSAAGAAEALSNLLKDPALREFTLDQHNVRTYVQVEEDDVPTKRQLVIHEARYGYADPLWSPVISSRGCRDVTHVVRSLVRKNELHINPDRKPQYMNQIFALNDMAPKVRRLGVRFSYGDDPIHEVTTDGVSQETVALHVTDAPIEEGPAKGWVGKLKLLGRQDGHVLRFPGLRQGGAPCLLECTGGVVGGIVLEYPETRHAGPWQYTEIGVGRAEDAIRVSYDGEFVVCDDGRVLDVSNWSYEVGNHLVIVRGSDAAMTYQGRGGNGGRSFTLNDDQTLSPTQAPHLALGVVPPTWRIVAPHESAAAAEAKAKADEEAEIQARRSGRLRDLDIGEYEVLDPPDSARQFSSVLQDFGKVWNKSRLHSEISWAPGPAIGKLGKNEWMSLDAGAERTICGVVISGCGCCKCHPSRVRLSVSKAPNDQWTECGEHGCLQHFAGGDHYDVLKIAPTVGRYVKINPVEWINPACDHSAIRCGLLAAKRGGNIPRWSA